MKQQKIEKRNKEICLMLGLKPLSKPYLGAFQTSDNTDITFKTFFNSIIEEESWYAYPKFDSDWNWLMHAVEYIEKVGETEDMYGNVVDISTIFVGVGNIQMDLKIKYRGMSKIDAVFKMVSDFAKKYNKDKKSYDARKKRI